MASEAVMSADRAGTDGGGNGTPLADVQREFWLGLGATLAEWGRGLAVCLAGGAVLQGGLAACPVMLWWGIPVTLPVTALAVALVGLRAAPQWGPVFAACVGLLADAAGPALPGATAWAYLPAAVLFALVHRHLRREHGVTLVLYAALQAMVQTTGSYVSLRWAGVSATPGHVAVATVVFSTLLALLAAICLALMLHCHAALSRRLGR